MTAPRNTKPRPTVDSKQFMRWLRTPVAAEVFGALNALTVAFPAATPPNAPTRLRAAKRAPKAQTRRPSTRPAAR
jgi:hypothetical protein